VKTTAASGWDNSITQEFIFERCNRWLNHYIGVNHGVTFGVSEYGFTNNNANVSSVSYASVLGTFADHGVEYFSPWFWQPGMWETLHLFSRYSKTTRVQSLSSEELNVSGYSSVNAGNDSMTVILVNRSLSASKTVNVNISNFAIPNGTYTTKRLVSLPSSETFVSHASNALVAGTAVVAANSLTVTLPPLSTTAVILKGVGVVTGVTETVENVLTVKLYPNPGTGESAYLELGGEKVNDLKMEVFNALGAIIYSGTYPGQNPALIEIPCAGYGPGVYLVKLSSSNGKKWTSRLVRI
jgi:hypothetical protein